MCISHERVLFAQRPFVALNQLEYAGAPKRRQIGAVGRGRHREHLKRAVKLGCFHSSRSRA